MKICKFRCTKKSKSGYTQFASIVNDRFLTTEISQDLCSK